MRNACQQIWCRNYKRGFVQHVQAHSALCTQYMEHSVQHTVHGTRCTEHAAYRTVYSTRCTWCIQCTCTQHTLQHLIALCNLTKIAPFQYIELHWIMFCHIERRCATLSSRICHACTEIVTFCYTELYLAILYQIGLHFLQRFGYAWKWCIPLQCNCVQMYFSANFANYILLHSIRLPKTVLILLLGTNYMVWPYNLFLPAHFIPPNVLRLQFTRNLWTSCLGHV